MRELIREAINARRAAYESEAGTDEHESAMRWKVESGAKLMVALGAKRIDLAPLAYRIAYAGCKPRRNCLTFFPALRRVHRPEAV